MPTNNLQEKIPSWLAATQAYFDVDRGLILEMYQVLDEPADPTKTKASSSANAAFEPKSYRHFLDDSDWSDAQKDEFITALWEIVVGFVDHGFGSTAVQQALRVRNTSEALVEDDAEVLSLRHTFNKTTHIETARLETSAARKKES